MKLKPLGLSNALLILSLLFTGCVGVHNKDQPRIVTGRPEITPGPCSYELDTNPAGYVKVPNGIKLAPDQPSCRVSEGRQIHIGHVNKEFKRVRSFLVPQEIRTEGSCRWCYPNAAGGLSCVTYEPPPGATCPF